MEAGVANQRLQTRRKRGKRLKRIASAKARALVWNTGPIPAAIFGAEVYGFSDADQRILEQATTQQRGGGKGKWSTMFSCVFDDASWKAAVAPIIEWSRRVWSTLLVADCSGQGSLTQLMSWWRRSRGCLPNTWGAVRGPLGAAELSMQRIGWTWTSPLTWTDHEGIERTFTQSSPAMVQSIARKAYLVKKETEAARQRGLEEGSLDFSVARKLLLGSKLPVLEQGCLRSFLARSVWTRARLANVGLCQTSACKHCGKLDTLEHIL